MKQSNETTTVTTTYSYGGRELEGLSNPIFIVPEEHVLVNYALAQTLAELCGYSQLLSRLFFLSSYSRFAGKIILTVISTYLPALSNLVFII